ncbi:MAG: hypothetical protein ACLQVF_47285, partial [Isosphaeraceae bacterium]
VLFPGLVPPGITTTLLLVLFFGSLNFFGISVLGEYLAKIFEEVKRRPHFIRRSMIRDGEVRNVGDFSLTRAGADQNLSRKLELPGGAGS